MGANRGLHKRRPWAHMAWTAALLLAAGGLLLPVGPACAGEGEHPAAITPPLALYRLSGGPAGLSRAQESTPGQPEEEGPAVILEKSALAVREAFGGQEIMVGGVFQSAQLRLYKDQDFPDGATPIARMTRKGSLDFALRYKTSESYLVDEEMRVGRFRIGYDFELHYNAFETDRQLLLNELEGEDIGTAASGQLLGGGPLVFIRLGPLYADRPIFWKAGAGAGAGLIEFEGTVLFRNNASPYSSQEAVSHRSSRLNLFLYALWMVEWGRWRIMFLENNLRGDTDFGSFLYRESSLIVGYTLRL